MVGFNILTWRPNNFQHNLIRVTTILHLCRDVYQHTWYEYWFSPILIGIDHFCAPLLPLDELWISHGTFKNSRNLPRGQIPGSRAIVCVTHVSLSDRVWHGFIFRIERGARKQHGIRGTFSKGSPLLFKHWSLCQIKLMQPAWLWLSDLLYCYITAQAT